MGMFDYYEPKPPLACPKCGDELEGWQGKDGPRGLFEWVQGSRGPSRQLSSTLPESRRSQFLSTGDWLIYTGCSCGTGVDAIASLTDGVWTHTHFLDPLEPPGLPDGWHLMTWDERKNVLAELQREIPFDHILHGRRMIPLARHSGCDEVLIRTVDTIPTLYVVHLTWRVESDPAWPGARAFSNLSEFAEEWEF